MEYNIGERARVKAYDRLPESAKNKGIAKVCGKDGEIVDKLWSEAKGCTIYKIKLDGAAHTSAANFPAEAIDLLSELNKKAYNFEVEILSNLVLVKFFELGEDSKTEISRGHGHIIHEGEIGIAQAASYALKKIYQKLTEF